VTYGHIKISRKAYATDLWWREPRIFSKWEAWEDCIQMAAFKEMTDDFGVMRLHRLNPASGQYEVAS
jgi:hypothetical protein